MVSIRQNRMIFPHLIVYYTSAQCALRKKDSKDISRSSVSQAEPPSKRLGPPSETYFRHFSLSTVPSSVAPVRSGVQSTTCIHSAFQFRDPKTTWCAPGSLYDRFKSIILSILQYFSLDQTVCVYMQILPFCVCDIEFLRCSNG